MTPLPWWAASILSNVAIMYVEHTNRGATGGWLSVLPLTFIPIVVAQFCLFRAFNGAPHWLYAWAVFAVGNAVMRLGLVKVLGEQVGSWPLALAAVTIIMLGSVLMKTALTATP